MPSIKPKPERNYNLRSNLILLLISKAVWWSHRCGAAPFVYNIILLILTNFSFLFKFYLFIFILIHFLHFIVTLLNQTSNQLEKYPQKLYKSRFNALKFWQSLLTSFYSNRFNTRAFMSLKQGFKTRAISFKTVALSIGSFTLPN